MREEPFTYVNRV